MVILYLPIWGNAFYLIVINVMLSAFSCSADTPQTLMADNECGDALTACWSTSHVVVIIAAALALLLFYPFSVRTQPFWQTVNRSLDYHFFPFFLLFNSQIKFVLSVLSLLFTRQPWVNLVASFCAGTFLCIYSMASPPNIYFPLQK